MKELRSDWMLPETPACISAPLPLLEGVSQCRCLAKELLLLDGTDDMMGKTLAKNMDCLLYLRSIVLGPHRLRADFRCRRWCVSKSLQPSLESSQRQGCLATT